MIVIKHKDTHEVLRTVDADTLDGADLSGADLRGAYMCDAHLSEANLLRADLRGAYMRNVDLVGANLSGANLRDANLRDADLSEAILRSADLNGAKLINTDLGGASLIDVNLCDADLSCANMCVANLSGVRLSGADLTLTTHGDTIIAFCHDLHKAKGLGQIAHMGPSALDRYTLQHCVENLPDLFLKGYGYTQHEIEQLRALYTDSPIKFFSCFISHGEPDLSFAERLLADLQQSNVTCWHYKQDMRGGRDWEDQINQAIKFHDKLILVCSRSAVYRPNVVKEILQAIRTQHETGQQKLFPIRLDDHILSNEMLDDEIRNVKADVWPGVWVEEVKRKHIPDFSGWDTDNNKYKEEFKKLLEALRKSG